MNVPRNVRRAIERAGGLNPYGQPNFRVVWSADRLEVQGGCWDEYLLNGKIVEQSYGLPEPQGGIFLRTVTDYRNLPKYWTHSFSGSERWIVEKWMAPEYYGSMASWLASTREFINGQEIFALGPYPEHGDYELCWIGEDQDGNFISLTSEIVQRLVDAIRYGSRFSPAQKKQALLDREERKERAIQAQNEAMVADAMLPFHGAKGEIVICDWDQLPALSKKIN